MNKSKLNRRQLKKISRKAANFCIENYSNLSKRNLFFDKYGEDFFHGEFGFWTVGDYDGEYCSESSIHVITNDYYDRHTNWRKMGEFDATMKISIGNDYYSLSYSNRIHHIINYLKSIK